ncbi:tRNA (N6-threonylcarbamoyladenosine(37)-N6)-methyltransferase TrmO [Nocardioides sp. CFH 31398]|uniref:tRNA (N6-threonylcarbamoyladenosine(37)-N6)-methyltransferase TrmO n=1 Tax=Nocardioides sp. CFH 31398 TaxID=2919579 RepID=UPI001F06F559|nr:tRNA (N6-threonylcarbamoyladenosine(37)-N6)-methyltransferase TrmO [Nocardioides sp. CFH 31398]MCH1867973.1 tRNA (N6-threonylcarbamoyladenosine(37)-N6)-methyltransferase TrmO [Nocardioides sp. CFH 31398]
MTQPASFGPTVIGVLRTARTAKADTPVQAHANLGEEGSVELDPAYAAGLEGLEGFTHAWLLTWLHEADPCPPTPEALRQRPFLRPDGEAMGVFAMRGPRRPSPIGLSLVEVVAVEGTRVRFRGVDVLDGTPLLDLKPFFPDADVPRGPVRAGWFDEVEVPEAATPASLRGRRP